MLYYVEIVADRLFMGAYNHERRLVIASTEVRAAAKGIL